LDVDMGNSTTYLLLIRHGENDWVGSNRLAGRTPGVHLNEKGVQQSQALANLLSEQPIRAIFSSPLERCLETAEPLAQRLGLQVTSEPGVIEVDYGEWRGQDLKELAKDPAWNMVQHYPSSFRFPNGETLKEVQHRAVSTLDHIHQTHPNQTVAIFSHGDVIRTSLAHYLGTHIDLFQRIAISTASVSVLALSNQRPMVLGVNYVATLPKFEIKPEETEN
jgi:probable phosphoglycerate mutase